MAQRLFDAEIDESRPGMVEVARIAEFLLDEAYMDWSAASEECDDALAAWNGAGPGERDPAYARYVAALEREEAAAEQLRLACAAVGPE